MHCSELRELEVTVSKVTILSAWDEVETMREILASIELKELDNLDNLIINFGNVETCDEDSQPQSTVGPWIGSELPWEPLKRACAARNFTCSIHHPK